MKRLFCLLCSLTLFLSWAAAEEAAPPPLSVAELNAFTAFLVERALAEGLTVTPAETGYQAAGDGYVLYFDSGDLSDDTVLTGAILLPGEDGPAAGLPRGVAPGATVQALLSAYPDDNPNLAGTAQGAVLYLRGELPLPVGAGLLTREGQELRLIEHSLYFAADGGFLQSGLQYTLEEDRVAAVRYFAGGEVLGAEKVEEALLALSALQEETDYFAYDTLDPGPLAREDLSVMGMDFLELTPQDAAALLGLPVHESLFVDSTGETLLTQQWEAVEIAFVLDEGGQLLRTDRFTLSLPGVEGPRGLRVGDSLPAVLKRFEHGEGPLPQGSAVLYGDPGEEAEPWGLLTVEGASAQLHYAARIGEGEQAVLALSFLDGILVEMSLLRL